MKKLLELRTSLVEGGYDINILTQLLESCYEYNNTWWRTSRRLNGLLYSWDYSLGGKLFHQSLTYDFVRGVVDYRRGGDCSITLNLYEEAKKHERILNGLRVRGKQLDSFNLELQYRATSVKVKSFIPRKSWLFRKR